MNYIHEIFSDIFDSLRATNTCSDIVNISGGTYEITTPSTEYLQKDDYVSFEGTDGLTKRGYKVSSIVSDTAFRILAEKNIVLGAFGTWKSKSWYFLPGITEEMSNTITAGQNSKTKDVTPCGWLVTGFEVINDKTNRFGKIIPNLRLVLFNRSKRDKSTVDRYDDNYKSTIDPFFERFLDAMQRELRIFSPRNRNQYSYEDKVMYDSPTKNNKWTMITDAKIIDFSNLGIYNNNCNF